MRLKLFCVSILLLVQVALGQEGFQFETKKNKISIPFKFINNLIIINIKVNDVPLNFLLDTGVEQSILFSLDETDQISFAQMESVKIKGFGKKEAFDGYKSTLNEIKIKDFVDKNHTLYLVLDQNINISSDVGVPVNGIIGYHFFKNNLVKIDFENNRIIIYKNSEVQLATVEKSFSKVPLQFHNGKPYLNSSIKFENVTDEFTAKLLIDTGNTDAVWLFKEKNNQIKIPQTNVEDYLGRGFSGDVFGFRGRVPEFSINEFSISQPIIAFPNANETTEIDAVENRSGSIGSEIIKRFTVYFHYKSQLMYLKKNHNFNNEFNFNMSGIDLHHQGLQWVKESYDERPAISNVQLSGHGDVLANSLKYKFELKPIYVITNIRKNSPADLAGLKKDDIIVKINKKVGYNYSLEDINHLLKSQEGKTIEFTIDRNGKIITTKFQLKKVL